MPHTPSNEVEKGETVPASKPKDDKKNPENRQDQLDKRLDEGLEETFPSSDPVAVKVTK